MDISEEEQKHREDVKWLALQLVELIPDMTAVRGMEVAQKLIYRYGKRETSKGEKEKCSF